MFAILVQWPCTFSTTFVSSVTDYFGMNCTLVCKHTRDNLQGICTSRKMTLPISLKNVEVLNNAELYHLSTCFMGI